MDIDLPEVAEMVPAFERRDSLQPSPAPIAISAPRRWRVRQGSELAAWAVRLERFRHSNASCISPNSLAPALSVPESADFARTYVGPRLPHRRDRLVRRLEEASDDASARIAARAFGSWAIAEGLLAEEP